MGKDDAIAGLAGLAHESRLDIFRLLVRAGPEGMAAGEIARSLGLLQNTLSTQLGILARVGLVQSRRDGRSIIYSAGYERMSELLAFLMQDCCAGKPEICAPLAALASSVCGPEGRAC